MQQIDPDLDIAPIDSYFIGGSGILWPTTPLGWVMMIGFMLFFGWVFWKTWKDGGFSK